MGLVFDAHRNLAIAHVTTPPAPATSGTVLSLTPGHENRFPAAPFNATIWPDGLTPDPTNAEIVRVTAATGNTLTIQRAQEGTTARAVGAGDVIAATITAKTISDIQDVMGSTMARTLPSTYTVTATAWADVPPFTFPLNPGSYDIITRIQVTSSTSVTVWLQHAFTGVGSFSGIMLRNASSLAMTWMPDSSFTAVFGGSTPWTMWAHGRGTVTTAGTLSLQAYTDVPSAVTISAASAITVASTI